ncbi:type I-E CRISPR-associated endonuclease Cas1e [Dethiosulfatarculus sandiegensis]|uniref:type I-E CRISPR-associated endonuclease Cas1e n=1 Tax=Dethiosulfatarculus sandiegensis TaxID=1429043 RepID=UPI000AE5F244|nr:type I-E CRISPR-associated endonuclease Cas1e [Dethiosulfatarculus sandiegensis]
MSDILPKLKPLAMKERTSILFLERGRLDVLDGSFVLVDKNGVRTHIPIGSVACLMLEPGIRVSHAAVSLAARVGCLLVWVGEAGVRVYSSGQPGGARADRLLYQAALASDPQARLKVVREMYKLRFGQEPPIKRSVEQMRGIEGARVREMYKQLARKYRIEWHGRRYNPQNWERADIANKCLSAANACLYGITEAAVLAAGYSPAVGFIHSGRPLSFVYDMADLFKFQTVVPVAFRVAAKTGVLWEREVRLGCRDMFRQTKILKRIIPTIEKVLAAGGLKMPKAPKDSQGPVLPEEKSLGDAGHRS